MSVTSAGPSCATTRVRSAPSEGGPGIMRREHHVTRSDGPVDIAALHQQALEALGRHEVIAAEKLARAALGHLCDQPDTVPPDLANILNVLVDILLEQGRLHEAHDAAARSVAFMESVVDEPGTDVERVFVQALVRLGNLLRLLGRYADADPVLERALARAEIAFEAEDPEIATVLNALGVLHKFQGRFSLARERYERARGIVEATLGEDHVTLAVLYHNLAGLAFSEGDCARGEALARRGLAIREANLGRDAPSVASDLAALAPLIDGQGRNAEAELLYGRAIDLFERHGHEPHEMAVAVGNLAVNLQRQGRMSEAEASYARALAMSASLLGAEHPQVATTLNNFGVFLYVTGRRAEAKERIAQALALLERHQAPDHPELLACRASYQALDRNL
jgi:tetratricopeptide (TPR) repeat protein